MSKENKRHETVYVGSMELLQELAKKNALHNLKTVKFKDGYPLFGFVGVFVAVPVAAVIGVFVRRILKWYRSTPVYLSAPKGSKKKK